MQYATGIYAIKRKLTGKYYAGFGNYSSWVRWEEEITSAAHIEAKQVEKTFNLLAERYGAESLEVERF
jgi:hypothetical protein